MVLGTYWVSWERTSQDGNEDNSPTADGTGGLKIEYPGKIGTDFQKEIHSLLSYLVSQYGW